MNAAAVTAISHRFLGPMCRLAIAPDLACVLTPLEAQTLARALRAVAEDHSRVEEIYLSPNASDREFLARVTEDGLRVAAAPGADILMPWTDVAALAKALLREAAGL